MANNTETYWDADGESLHTYARSIETLGGMGPPPLRGEDITIPLRSGRTWVPKKYDANTITLAMWLRGLKDRVRVATNLLPNGGFEASSGAYEVDRNFHPNPRLTVNATGWYASASTSRAAVPGRPDLPFAWWSGGAVAIASGRVAGAQLTGLTVGRQYTAVIKVLAEQTGWSLGVWDAVITSPSSPTNSSRALAASPLWREESITFIAATTGATIGLYATGIIADSAYGVTDISVGEGPTARFFDGANRPKARRNLTLNPKMLTLAGWTFAGSGVSTATETLSGIRVDFTAAQAHNAHIIYPAVVIPTSSQVAISGSYEIEVPEGYPAVNLQIRVNSYAVTSSSSVTSMITVQPGETKTLTSAALTTGVGDTGFRVILQTSGTMPAGSRFFIRNSLSEEAAIPGKYFDGTSSYNPGLIPIWEGPINNSASYVYDDDLTPGWVSTANNSPSILSGKRATYAGSISTSWASAFQSSHWASEGTQSLRVGPYGYAASVPNSAIGAFIDIAPLTEAGKTYTIIVKVRKTGIATSLPDLYGAVDIYDGAYQSKVKTPNSIGVHEARFIVSRPTSSSTFQLRLVHGQPKNTADDIWFDEATIVEGVYTGPSFTGNTPGAEWDGAANASPSSFYMELRDGTPDKAQFQSNWNDLIRLLWTPGRQVALRKRFYDGGVLRAATAMVEYAGGLQPSMIGNNAAKCTIDLSIARGVFYNDVEAVHGLINGDNYITVLGNAPTTNIQVTIQGARTNAKLRNVTLGVEFTYPRVLNSGITATVDVDNYLVTDTSQPAKDMSTAVIHSGDDQWLTLVPGVNVINLSSSFGTGAVTLRYRAAWV